MVSLLEMGTKIVFTKIDLEKYNVIIDGRNFYDNPIESDI